MDNDNPLLQKAADLYRGLRFTMKYRGVDILPAAAGNDLARDLLESGQPFLFGRCGATEMRTVADWLQNGGHNFTDRTRADIRNLSGVFPTDDATLDKMKTPHGGQMRMAGAYHFELVLNPAATAEHTLARPALE